MFVSNTDTDVSRSNDRCDDTHSTDRANSLWLPERRETSAAAAMRHLRLGLRPLQRVPRCAGAAARTHQRDAVQRIHQRQRVTPQRVLRRRRGA